MLATLKSHELKFFMIMIRRPSPNNGTTIRGTNDRSWFEELFKNPNIKLEPSIAFLKTDVLELLNQPKCGELLISKQEHDGVNTLAMVGIGTNVGLQMNNYTVGGLTKEHIVLVGTYFGFPVISNKNIDLKLTQMNGAEDDGQHNHIDWETQYASMGKFKEVISNYMTTPKHANHFSTVNFNKNKIIKVLTDEVEKLAFISGYVTLIQRDIGHPDNDSDVGVITQTNLETLIAVAMDKNDNVVGDPIIPIAPWPVRWKQYS